MAAAPSAPSRCGKRGQQVRRWLERRGRRAVRPRESQSPARRPPSSEADKPGLSDARSYPAEPPRATGTCRALPSRRASTTGPSPTSSRTSRRPATPPPKIGFMMRLLDALHPAPRQPRRPTQYVRRNGPYLLTDDSHRHPAEAALRQHSEAPARLGLHRGRPHTSPARLKLGSENPGA